MDSREPPEGRLLLRIDPGVTCAEDIAVDDALLAQGRLAVRVAVLSDHAVSIGVGGGPSAGFLDTVRAESLPIVRRSTGGTGVLHAPGDLAWTLVLPRDHPWVGRDFVTAYDRFGSGVAQFLSDRGVATRWAPPPALSEDYCLLSGRGRVLWARDRVLGGAAQHLGRNALLHHGILTARIDRERAARLTGLAQPAIDPPLTSLAELGIAEPARELAVGLAEALVRSLGRR